jgi:uncharacterized RDD family membrane protein YckC
MKTDGTPGKHGSQLRLFNPHETARAQSLAGTALAPFGRRLAAILIDLAIVVLTQLPVKLALKYLLEQRLHIGEPIYQSAHVQARFDLDRTLDLAWTLWLILYFGVIVWKTNGLTPGKRLLRIRIVSLSHARIPFWQAVERALGYGASALEGGFGFIQFFLNHNRLCTHDRIAETIVVQDPRRPEAPRKLNPLQ